MIRRSVAAPTAILDAALAVAAREGLEAASLRRVAREAGTSKSSVLHHFGSAAGLRRSMISRVGQLYQELTVRAAAAQPGPDLESKGPGILQALFRRENRDLFICVRELMYASLRDPLIAAEARTAYQRSTWMITVLLGPPVETAMPTAEAIFAVVQGYIDLWLSASDGDPKPFREGAERAAGALIRGRGGA
jgi:AcrR family transcriptional regulator